MTRTAAFAVTILFAAAVEAQEPIPQNAADPAAAEPADAEPAEAAPEEEEGYVEDEEVYDDSEVEFCGGGDEEESQVALASYEIEEGRYMRARRMIIEALRTGQVAEWERPVALSLLGEAQLQTRQYRQAIVNYRKSLHIDEDSAPASRVGLATALYMTGQYQAAHQEAIDARDALCGDQWSYVACFGAQAVLAHTSAEGAERDTATQALTTIRAAHPENAEQFDRAERRLERGRRRAPARGGRS